MAVMFFYGTLKRGFYNNARVGLDDPKKATFLGRAALPDHAIVVRGTLPYAFQHEDSSLEGEVFDVHDEKVIAYIEAMERGAGYAPVEVTVYGADTESSYKVNFYRVQDRRLVWREGDKVSTFYDEESAKI